MALSAARAIKSIHPDWPIDLFCDVPAEALPADHVFDRVHPTGDNGTRPKFDALMQSRFEQTIYFDNDTRVVAPIGDIFDLLDRFDIALGHDQMRNSTKGRRGTDVAVPPVFPQLNSGVLAIRRNAATDAFLAEWKVVFEAADHGYDQPGMRQVLWQSETLRLAILPVEYNVWDVRAIDAMRPTHAAPRVLHSRFFKADKVRALSAGPRSFTDPLDDPALPLVLGHARLAQLRALLHEDRTLPGSPAAARRWRGRFTGRQYLGIFAGAVRDLPRNARLFAGMKVP
jgi:hypothetical protein